MILILLHQLRRNAPHVGETLVPGENSAIVPDDQNSVRSRVERRLQQSHRAPCLPLVAFPFAEVASDDHFAGDFTVAHHGRVRQRQLDRLTHLRSEHVLAIPQPAFNGYFLVAVHGDHQIVEMQADDVLAVVSEECAGGIVREANASFAITHQQQIPHRADDFGRRQRRRDC